MGITFGVTQTSAEKTATVKNRLGSTTGSSKGTKKPPKPKLSLKGTSIKKKKLAVTWKKEF